MIKENPEFSVQKFRELWQNRTKKVGQIRRLTMEEFQSVYWKFYCDKASPLRNLNELQILALSDEDILEAYAKWRIES